MVLPLIPLVVGGAAIAAGAGVSGKAARTKGTGVDRGFGHFGGSPESSTAFRDLTGAGMGAGGASISDGRTAMYGAAEQGRGIAALGGNLVAGGQRTQAGGVRGVQGTAGQLGAFQSQAPNMGAAVGQRTLDRGMNQATSLAGLARGGNIAAALSQSQVANSQAAQQAAQDAQITAAQQQMQAEQMQLQALQAAGQQHMGLAGLGQNQIGQGIGAQQVGLQADQALGGSLLDVGVSREATFLNAAMNQANTEAQLQTQLEIARAEGARQKRDRLFQLGGSLMGSGFSAIGSGAGGGGG